MSKFKGIIKAVTSVLGMGAPKVPALPAPAIPAPPAPGAVATSGADVSIGTSVDLKNQRVSGRTATTTTRKSGDPLGGLGRSGLNI